MCHPPPPGAVAVAEFIAESPRLLRLDLRENEIKTGGLMALSLALKVNTSLLRLDLDREPKKETVKSFIETQRALLAEIQNGCKRNFILAKEKEETDQKMRQSTSMAEIATEDGTGDEEEGPLDQPDQKGAGAESPGSQEAKDNSQSETTGSQPETAPDTEAPPLLPEESDSDTEDEEEEGEEKKVPPEAPSSADSSASPRCQPEAVSLPCGASLLLPPSPAVPIAGKSVLSAITVTESPLQHGTPPSPGRCISVSSPGKGHKIFMVTRVESPPDQQQQAKMLHQNNSSNLFRFPAPAHPGAGPHPADGPSPNPQALDQPRSSPPNPTAHDTDQNERCPVTPAPQSSHTTSPHTDSTRAHTIRPRPGEFGPSADEATAGVSPSPCVPEPSPSVRVVPADARAASGQLLPQTLPQLPEGVEDAGADTQSHRLTLNATHTGDAHTECQQWSTTQGGVSCLHKAEPAQPCAGELLPPQGPQDPRSSSQPQSDVQVVARCEPEVGPETLSENREEDTAEGEGDGQQGGGEEDLAVKMATGEQQPLVVPPPPPQVGMQEVPQTLEETQSSQLGNDQVTPPPAIETDIWSRGGEADHQGGCLDADPDDLGDVEAEMAGSAAAAAALPNGLRPEFSLHLLEAEGPKPASCLLEHVSVTAELSCGQDVEKLLLDASLETDQRDGP
ncbi:hypothetical protein CRUP_024606 [Coryphaenoides rupestris]|nr:hypothetical protein CRUP_024606 [Coryphaenoides rupestris]